MLDELLGRAVLKERIDELEEERHHLERRLDAESDRRADAVHARQEAEERLNRLEDRIAELEGRLETATDDEATDLDFCSTETLRGSRLSEVLGRLASLRTGEEGMLTAFVTDRPSDEVRAAFGDRAALLGRAAPCLAFTDDAGLASGALAPPIRPEPFTVWSDRLEFEREWFLPAGRFAFALVRSDLFALGEYADDERTAFTGFTSDVKGTHSKGGFSQGRFERRRDAQIDEHVERALAEIEDRDADRLFVVGERTVLGEFADVADQTSTVDATGDPEDALDDAVREFFTTTLYRI